jgi:hypothetical protein
MKKLIIPTGGHQFFPPDDLSHLNDAIVETATALGNLFGQNYYLSASASSQPQQSGSNIVVHQAGYLVFNGEICAYPAVTDGTLPVQAGKILAWVYKTTYRNNITLVTANMPVTTYQPHRINTVELQYYTSGTPPTSPYVDVSAMVPAPLAVLTTGSGTWTDIDTGMMHNGWDLPSSGSPPRYRLNPDRSLDFAGRIAKGAVQLALTMPITCRPIYEISAPVAVTDGGSSTIEIMTFGADGNISFTLSSTASEYSLDGLKFFLNVL